MKSREWTIPHFTVERVMQTFSQSVSWGVSALNIPKAWVETRGKGERVAVLDTGTSDHPDLVGAIVESRDFTNSRSKASDVNGHGTHCMGIIGARDNEIGVVGVGPECSILAGKVLGDDGSGTNRAIANGIRWAIDKGATIINLSLGSPFPDEIIHEAILEAIRAKVIVVAASGNSGPRPNTVEFPGKWPGVITVGASDVDGGVADFSSRGPEVDIVAPGVKVLSTYLNGGVAQLSGSSMATPFVVGVVALILAKHRMAGANAPPMDQTTILEQLRKAATDGGVAGPDPSYGWGIIDPLKALAGVTVPPAPVLPVPDGTVLGPEDFTATGHAKLKAAGLSRFSIRV